MYTLLILLIIVIVVIQFSICIKTYAQIKDYRTLFQGVRFLLKKYYVSLSAIQERPDASIETIGREHSDSECDDEVGITCVDTEKTIKHPTLKKIVQAINTYLLRNQGAVSDFLLVKDIVERNVEIKREVFHVQIPIPLYLGLMGTMLGIIFGIGAMVWRNGGIGTFIDSLGSSIGDLMGGVAIAMAASFIGLLFTTINSWTAKNADAAMEENKNDFYTWIQTQLLPHLGGMDNTLVTLQQNLLEFNRTFAVNTSKLDKSLGKLGDTYQSQTELLQTIQNLDIKKITTANVSVLRELQACIPHLERFTQYFNQIDNFIASANQLNANLNEQLSRTHLIEEMSEYFKREIEAIDERKSALMQAVGKVDDRLKVTVEALGEHAEQSMQKVNEVLLRKQNVFNSALDSQQEIMVQNLQETTRILEQVSERIVASQQKANDVLLQKQETFAETVVKLQVEWIQKLQKANGVFEELHNLSVLKEAIDRQNEKADQQLQVVQTLCQSIERQNVQIVSLAHSMESIAENIRKRSLSKQEYRVRNQSSKRTVKTKLSDMFNRLLKKQ